MVKKLVFRGWKIVDKISKKRGLDEKVMTRLWPFLNG